MKQVEFPDLESGSALINADLHMKIRKRLDPSSEFLSDDDIQKIMQMHFGREDGIVRQCILGISVIAEEARKVDVAVRFRRLLFSLESGNFDIHSDPGSASSVGVDQFEEGDASGTEIEIDLQLD